MIRPPRHNQVSNNVAYDVIGHCFYLEDGVEELNTISYNLAAHIHWMGDPVSSYYGQTADWVYEYRYNYRRYRYIHG